MDPMFDHDDDEEALPEPVFYTDGRVRTPGPSSFPRRFVYVAGPLWELATTPTEARMALDLANVAWNATRLPEPQRTSTLERLVRDFVDRTGSAEIISEMVMRAMRWPREERAVVEVKFEELHPGEWHVALLTLTAEEVRRATASRGARPRGRRRG